MTPSSANWAEENRSKYWWRIWIFVSFAHFSPQIFCGRPRSCCGPPKPTAAPRRAMCTPSASFSMKCSVAQGRTGTANWLLKVRVHPPCTFWLRASCFLILNDAISPRCWFTWSFFLYGFFRVGSFLNGFFSPLFGSKGKQTLHQRLL